MNQEPQLAHDARSSMYRLLASLYARELTEENIIGFREGPGRRLLDALGKVDTYAPVAALLKDCFAKMADPKKAALDLAESYAWNFHGVGGPHAAPLYASVYLNEKGSSYRKIERELRGILLDHGLSSVNYEKEPCDHLAVILEFISWLDEQEGTGLERETFEQTRKHMIEHYLLTWLSRFVDQCNRGDRFGFYSALSKETLALVTSDFNQI